MTQPEGSDNPPLSEIREISMLFKKTPPDNPTSAVRESGKIRDECAILNRIGTRGELGDAISLIILPGLSQRSPADETEFRDQDQGYHA